jgi:hypothetical protein
MDAATILTSGVLAAVVAGLITALSNQRLKQREFINDYYKTVLSRRIAAYENLEALIVTSKTVALDTDGKPYHLLFAREGDWDTAYNLIISIASQALWLSEAAFQKSRELNYLIFNLRHDDVIQFGKNNHAKISQLREDLEQIIATDMLEMHDIKTFLQQKRGVKRGFTEVKLNREGLIEQK